MPDETPLEYPHNGVICKNCFAWIDLTELGAEGTENVVKRWRHERPNVIYEPTDSFFAPCLRCETEKAYGYEDVKPLYDVKGLEERITKVEKHFTDKHFLSDLAETIIKMVSEREKANQEKANTDTGKNPLAH